jgi:hypothetical protein
VLGRVVEMLLLELVDADSLLTVGFGFCGAFGVDAAFGEEVGAAAGDYESGPAVAITLLVCVGSFGCALLHRVGCDEMD